MYLSQMPNNNYNLENLQFKNTYIILFWREEYRYKGNFTFDWIWISEIWRGGGLNSTDS